LMYELGRHFTMSSYWYICIGRKISSRSSRCRRLFKYRITYNIISAPIRPNICTGTDDGLQEGVKG
jgi:hypothetical protein